MSESDASWNGKDNRVENRVATAWNALARTSLQFTLGIRRIRDAVHRVHALGCDPDTGFGLGEPHRTD
jgi:hypothetical protein